MLLSTYLYQTNNYEKCGELIKRKIIFPITEFPHVVYCGKVRDQKQLSFALVLGSSRMSKSQLFKRLACCFFKLPTSLVPCELNIEACRYLEKGINEIPILPLPYAYFLSFRCSYHLHDVPLQLTSLRHLESMVNDKHFGFRRTSITHNHTLTMVGICFELMGDVYKAAYYYKLSTNIDKIPNESAYIRLQLLMIQNDI